jgi:predicted transcriptional regulator
VRGLTRDVNSTKSQKLAAQGVELVQADLDDAASLERAFQGADIIYAMTDFWQSMSAEIEFEQGKRIVEIAAALPDLEHFVWASLPDGKELSKGQFINIFHWQSKADLAKYIKSSKPGLWSKTIEILFPNYFENCVTNAPVYLPVKVRLSLSAAYCVLF